MTDSHLRACVRTVLASAALLALGLPAHANTTIVGYGSDKGNHFDPVVGSPTGYEFDLKGDMTGIVPAQPTTEMINPWGWLHNHVAGYAVNATTIVYDPIEDVTRITQSGTALPPVPSGYPYSYPDGNGNPTYHTGINMGNPNPSGPAPVLEVVSRHWIYGDIDTLELDAVTLSWTGKLAKKTKTTAYLTTFIRTLDPQTGVARAGVWADTIYDPTARKPFTITNNSGQPFVLETVGYIPNMPVPHDPACLKDSGCDSNMEELAGLNARQFPPPGDPGSTFIQVKFPREAIPPGGRFSFKVR